MNVIKEEASRIKILGNIATESYYKNAIEIAKSNYEDPHFFVFSEADVNSPPQRGQVKNMSVSCHFKVVFRRDVSPALR